MRSVSIEDFRGDFEALDAMAHKAWRDEYGADSYPNLYKPEYLRYLMQGIDDQRLAIAAYDGEEIVGFLLNLPRTMALDGKEYKAALSCLLVVRQESFRKGLAQSMIQEALRKNRELCFDFTLFYLETGHRSSRLFRKLKSQGMPIERVKRMNVIARVLDLDKIRASENVKTLELVAMKALFAHKPPGTKDAPVRTAAPDDAGAITVILNRIKNQVRLARVFTEEEVKRELIHPPIAEALLYEKHGEIKGVLAYAMVEHVGKTAAPWAWINQVAWGGLSFKERTAFVKQFLSRVGQKGAAGVVEWKKNCYPASALYASRFVPYPRRVDMMAWRFRDDISLSDIPDVYEVQI